MKHYNVNFQPDNLSTSIHRGATLLEAAGQVGIILSTPCGGRGRCRKCIVRLHPSGKEVPACEYIIEHELDMETRFDVITVIFFNEGHELEHFKDAFYPTL